MKRNLLTLLLVILCGAPLVSCHYDADAELKALEDEMTRLEQEDQRIRAHFLEKINSLRSRLTTLIAQVEADLKARIDKEGDALIHSLNLRVSALKTEILNGFNDSRDYMNQRFSSCKKHISDSFDKLDKSKDALEDLIRDALDKQETERVKKLMALESKLDAVLERAERVQNGLAGLEEKLASAEELNRRLNKVSTTLDDLDEAFGEMEQNQLALMQLVEDEITDEYLNSLTSAQLAQVKAAVADAEALIDQMESYKDELEDLSAQSEDMLGSMEDLSDWLGSAVDDYDSMLGDCEGALDNCLEFWSYFENSDAEDKLGEIESLAEENVELYDSTLDMLDEIDSHVETFYATVWDWEAQAHEFLQSAYDFGQEAIDKYEEIESVRG